MSRYASARAPELEEVDMEKHVGKLESDVAHIQGNVVEIKADLRDLRGQLNDTNQSIVALGLRMEESFKDVRKSVADLRDETKTSIATLRGEVKDSVGGHRVETKESFATLGTELRGSIATQGTELRGSIAALERKLFRSRWVDRVWWFTMSAALLAFMARALKWI